MNFNMHLHPFFIQIMEARDGIVCSFSIHSEFGRMWLKDESLPKDAEEADVRRACAMWCSKLLNKWRESFDAHYVEEVPPVGK